MPIDSKKISKSHKIAQARVKERVQYAEKRLAQYRKLVEAEGIQSQRLKAIDEARQSHKHHDHEMTKEIDSNPDFKKAVRGKKHWHRRNNYKQTEWSGIYKNMKSDYKSCDPSMIEEGDVSQKISMKRETECESLSRKRPVNFQAPPKRDKTRKGQPIMNLQISKMYQKCMRMSDGDNENSSR